MVTKRLDHCCGDARPWPGVSGCSNFSTAPFRHADVRQADQIRCLHMSVNIPGGSIRQENESHRPKKSLPDSIAYVPIFARIVRTCRIFIHRPGVGIDMANATVNDSPKMMELVSGIISEVGSFFGNIAVSPSYSIDDFPYQKADNYIYVLYSTNGMPLNVGAVLGSTGKRDQNRIIKEIQSFGANGYVETFRILELGSAEIARHIERLIQDLFTGTLPLKTSTQLEAEGGEPEPVPMVQPATTGKRRRRRTATSETSAAAPAKRRGRPRKSDAATAATPEGAVPAKRRGRPRKNTVGSETVGTAPAKRRGRPKKSATGGTETGAAPAKRRGRPSRKETAGETAGTAPAKRRGRPRKNAAPAPTE
jgi:hypothetical protein